MKNVKYCLNTLCLYDYQGVENHLSAMAAQGWRLERAGSTLWKYRRTDPAQVRYAVTYSGSASRFEPGPTEEEQSLEELCAAAGWEKVSDCTKMQIYSTEDPAAVPLETDEALRLQNIHRCMGRSFLPANLVILLLFLFIGRDFFLDLVTWDLYGMLKNNALLIAGVMCLAGALFQVYLLAGYFLWRRRSRRAVEEGGTCLPAGRGGRWASLGLWVLLVLLLAVFLLSELGRGHRGAVLYLVVYIILFNLIGILVRGTTALLRKKGVSKASNIAWTLVVDIVLAFTFIGALAYTCFETDWFSDDRPAGETYEYRDQEWDVSPRQDFPLTLAELTGERYDHVSREAANLGSFFVSERKYQETALFHDGPKVCGMSYAVYETRFPSLRDSLLEDLLEDDPVKFRGMLMFTRRYVPEDPAPWGAEAVYRRYIGEDPNNVWLLAWPGRVVELSLDWPPAEAQMALVSARLGPEA